MKKIPTILLASVLFAGVIVLASCSSDDDDTDPLTTDVAEDWLRLDTTTYVSDVYTTTVYDPTTDEDFSDTDYYKIWAPTDINSSIRLTLTEIDSSTFSSTTTNDVRYLQCSSFDSSDQEDFVDEISDVETSLTSEITDFTADIQNSWEEDITDYSITSDSLDSSADTNYLAVFYMPFLVQTYEDSEISESSFIIAPVYVTTTSLTDSTYSLDLANTYSSNDKIITFSYDSDDDIIS